MAREMIAMMTMPTLTLMPLILASASVEAMSTIEEAGWARTRTATENAVENQEAHEGDDVQDGWNEGSEVSERVPRKDHLPHSRRKSERGAIIENECELMHNEEDTYK